MTTTVAVAHDYLTQRGGAERVVLSMLTAFPDAPLFTSLYDPERTFPGFASHDVRPLPLNRARFLRHDHRRALPVLAPLFGRLRVNADVVLCSSSGWAHGVQAEGHKVVYCHAPARWLYQWARYEKELSNPVRWVAATLAPTLRRWDRAAAASADRYLTNSRATRALIMDAYGIEATVLAPPQTLGGGGRQEQVADLAQGFVLCVARLMPYKNVHAVATAFRGLPRQRLVVVGDGPDRSRVQEALGPNGRLLGSVTDAELRWLYANCSALVAASFEDYGLTPVEAAAFGKPTAALRWGGYLDTIAEGVTGVFFDRPEPAPISAAVAAVVEGSWSSASILTHASTWDEARFVEAIRAIIGDVVGLPTKSARAGRQSGTDGSGHGTRKLAPRSRRQSHGAVAISSLESGSAGP